jgi:murein DD-endopeptidase MepM/ murein hydrolase activator NlpD
MRFLVLPLCLHLGAAISAMGQDQTQLLNLALPTDNDALFHSDEANFYQLVERDFRGVRSTPWEGGRYGFVRNPIETAAGIIYSRFHEGIDIRPMRRDARGEPLDEVRAIADGKVVHANLSGGFSNYGRYVVIEHRWGGSNYYSLYGHLSSIAVQAGEKVQRSQRIGVMGHTGEGINQARAHLHLEMNLMLSHEFESWHNAFFRNDPNRHGLYNGLNLAGIDVARLYLALRKRPSLTLPEFLAQEEIFYKVTIPLSKHFDLPKLYRWLVVSTAPPEAKSWEVSFARTGVPLKIEPNLKPVSEPELTYFKKSLVNYPDLTRNVVDGRGDRARLTEYGKQLMRLLIYPD